MGEFLGEKIGFRGNGAEGGSVDTSRGDHENGIEFIKLPTLTT